MKNLCLGTLFIIVSTLVVINGTFANAEEGKYLGDFCWEVVDDCDTTVLRLGFSQMGDGHFIVSGKFIEVGETPHLLHGSAEIDGGFFYISLMGSEQDYPECMVTGMKHLIIDLSTGNGTYETINHEYNYSDLSISHEYIGLLNMNIVPCP